MEQIRKFPWVRTMGFPGVDLGAVKKLTRQGVGLVQQIFRLFFSGDIIQKTGPGTPPKASWEWQKKQQFHL